MASVVSGTSIEHVRSEIKKIEDNCYNDQPNPTINKPPAERHGGEDGFKKKKSY